MRTTAMAAALLVLTQCAPAQDPMTAASGNESAIDCIDLGAVTSRAAEDERTIRFDMIGGAVYRNRLPGRCPGLQSSSRGFGTLAFDVQGNRLCRGDLLRVVDSARGSGGYRSAVPCPLGDFIPAEPAPGAR
ncbi:hypothetical protein [Sphingosinicella sp. CPCC 101087]|uniref:hypothetical protein n=1 Tax=Sphingosinicella sp. CPCC 101087 TaxID=2497754 RepID=UPI00101B83D7|nr:hypothetical protein [Sphingosinicella sp. CPCC 101087]